MKVLNSTLVMVMSAGMALAQPPSQAVKAPAKPAAQPASKPAAAPAATKAQPKANTAQPAAAQAKPAAPAKQAATPAAKPAAKSAAKTPAPMPSPMKPKPAATAAKASMAAPEMAKAKGSAGKRDPFVSPIVKMAMTNGPGANCATGPKCLVPSEMALRGVVRSPNGMIAVVESPQRKTYFLRQNDPVFNGFVSRITGDSITIRENGMDQFGNPTTRDVVRKLNPTTT